MTAAYAKTIEIANMVQATVVPVLQLLDGTQALEKMERVNPAAHSPHRTPRRLDAH